MIREPRLRMGLPWNTRAGEGAGGPFVEAVRGDLSFAPVHGDFSWGPFRGDLSRGGEEGGPSPQTEKKEQHRRGQPDGPTGNESSRAHVS